MQMKVIHNPKDAVDEMLEVAEAVRRSVETGEDDDSRQLVDDMKAVSTALTTARGTAERLRARRDRARARR